MLQKSIFFREVEDKEEKKERLVKFFSQNIKNK